MELRVSSGESVLWQISAIDVHAVTACGKQNAVYRATVDFLPDQLATIHITFLDTSTAETLYELSASCYQPISLSTTGGMQYE